MLYGHEGSNISSKWNAELEERICKEQMGRVRAQAMMQELVGMGFLADVDEEEDYKPRQVSIWLEDLHLDITPSYTTHGMCRVRLYFVQHDVPSDPPGWIMKKHHEITSDLMLSDTRLVLIRVIQLVRLATVALIYSDKVVLAAKEMLWKLTDMQNKED